jgi:hypothetical protein
VTPEYLDLGIKEYVIDSCAVVVNKGRIVRHRPRIDHWKCKFELEYDDVLLTANQVRKIVDDAGERCGLLDYRPSKKGPFGRFCVVERFCVIHWEAIVSDDGKSTARMEHRAMAQLFSFQPGRAS